MRLGFIGPIPPLRGGIAQHGSRVVAALRQSGHEVVVASWRSQYPRLLYRGDHPSPGELATADDSFTLRWWSPLSWWRAGRRLRDTDAVIVPWVTPFHAVPLRVATGAADRPCVAIVHNAEPHERLPATRFLTRFGLRHASAALTHGKSVASAIIEITGMARTTTIPHPPNLHVERTPLPDRPPHRLLFTGFIRAYKGLDVLLDALPAVIERRPTLEVTVAGQFWESSEAWHERVRTEGLGGHVTIHEGYVPDDRLVDLITEHHLLVAPYRSASQSGLVPLALAAGRPVTVTRVGDLPEVVTDGVNGTLADPGDATSLADAIDRALTDIDSLAANARSPARWTDVVGALECLVAEVPS
jgi:glycosyltransferase involved in cell wall biosynthesis